MRFIFSLSLLCLGALSSLQAQYLVSTELVSTYTAEELNFVPGMTTEFDIEFYKIIYNTIDAVGEPTIASGAFSRPVSDVCTHFPLAIYNHGTTLNKEDVPSRDNSEAQISKFMGGIGYYSLAPDYVGMGDGPGLHPYVHAESEATAGVDMIRAVREFLTSLGETDNGEVLITGYSQGGHAAMALHKYIEDNSLLDEFNVIINAPGSGPYNMSGSQSETILSGQPYTNPGYIVYALSSYELAYGNIYSSYSEVLQSPYDGIVVPYFNGNNTTLNMGSLNPQLPQLITDLMTPAYYNAFESDMSHPFRVALADNDNFDWTPERAIRMFYCTLDEQVAYTNATDALDAMTLNGAPDVTAVELGPLDHSNCFLPAMLGAVNIFNALRTECIVSSVDELDRISFKLYPNPAKDRLNIESELNLISWEIMNPLGEVVMRSGGKKSSRGMAAIWSIDIAHLPSGMYTLAVQDINEQRGEQIFIK